MIVQLCKISSTRKSWSVSRRISKFSKSDKIKNPLIIQFEFINKNH